jgi:hypothetical protein
VEGATAFEQPANGFHPADLALMVGAFGAALVQGLRIATPNGGSFQSADLPAYLVGWRMAASRSGGSLYDLGAQAVVGGEVLQRSQPGGVCPFNYPPHLALGGAWLPPLTYQGVVVAAAVINAMLLLAAAVFALAALRRGRSLTPLRLVATFVLLASLPASWLAVEYGSITPFVVLGAVGVWWGAVRPQLLRGWLLSIGLLAMSVKPHYVVVLVICLIGARAWQHLARTAVLGGVAIGGSTLWFGSTVWSDYGNLLRTFAGQDNALCRSTRTMVNVAGTLTRSGLNPEVINVATWGCFTLGLAVAYWLGHRCRATEIPTTLPTTLPNTLPNTLIAGLATTLGLALLVSPHANPQDTLLALPLAVLLMLRSNRLVRAAVWSVLIVMGIGAEVTMIQVAPLVIAAGLTWITVGERRFTVPLQARLRSNVCPTD